MKAPLIAALALSLAVTSCNSFFKPKGWPVTVAPSDKSVNHLIEHVKFTGSGIPLTQQERTLLTFLDSKPNIAASTGKKNRPQSHQWSAAEIYRVDPGKHISVLCENGYQQTAVYFHYDKQKKTWFRVKHLGENHNRGVPAVVVK
ncbi:MAG: hypothetical protein KJO21_09830 [Verrucomicrobiae bacterium]|nr:hypothetical protein [Verrucomicrobiae bacterium]NNJ43758.1 hypothetical protein [Akkermansiaceae bacterium]